MTKNLLIIVLFISQYAYSIEFTGKKFDEPTYITGYSSFGDLNGDGFKDIFTSLGVFEKPRDDCWRVNSSSDELIRFEYDYAS
ncbi:MAG: hypothetical protein JKY19_04020 [Alcanivoracaceae bacterium]|nr:hypothetical protein [Alcanivoracaceae bacterium]